MNTQKFNLIFFILIVFLLLATKSKSQCFIENYVTDGKNIKVSRPKPVVVETKTFSVVILGLSKYDNDYYFINIAVFNP